jgi:hypothetical protein
MKMRTRKRFQEQGSALIITLFIACILGIGLGSCLMLVRYEHDSAVRSQAWNTALILAEGGVEEALAKLNPGASAALPVAGTYGPLSRSLAGGSYDVAYALTSASATIYATGRVTVPSISATLSRVVQVSATNAPLLTTALATKGQIEMNGGRLSSDSYDSADPNLSNNGQYPGWQSGKTSTNGDVAIVTGVSDASYVRVYGDLLLGPAASSGFTNFAVISGIVRHDFTVDFPDVVVPATVNWLPALPVTYSTNGMIYDKAFLQNGSFTISGLNGNLYVGEGVNVTLQISDAAVVGDIWIAGIGNNAGKLTIYMTGASFSVNGDMTVESGSVNGFTYFGLPGNAIITLNGTPDFIGTIYAPGTALSVINNSDPWSWDYDTFNFTGSTVIGSVNVNGYSRSRFHYDENLKRAGTPRRGFVATAWNELPRR